MLSVTEKKKLNPQNKLQAYAHKKGIYSVNQFRDAVAGLGISSGTAWTMWRFGKRAHMYDAMKAVSDYLGAKIEDVFEA